MDKTIELYKTIYDFGMNLQHDYKDIETTIEAIGQELEKIRNTIGVEKAVAALDSPGTTVNPRGEHGRKLIFDKGLASSDNAYSKDFFTGGGGHAIISLYPNYKTGFLINEDMLEYLATVIFRVIGRVRMNSFLKHAQITDLLTGLCNADGFILKGREMLRKGILDKYSAFYINVKNFKFVNEAVGYMKGNRVVVAYAAKLLRFIEPDEVLGRLGGDNFVALVKKERERDFAEFLQKVTVNMEFENESRVFTFGAACGVFEINEVDDFGQVMMAIAITIQIAREKIKGNIVKFSKEIFADTMNEKGMLMGFSQVLDTKQIEVFYQAKVNIDTGKIVGAEALSRWMRDGEVVAPDSFIPILEKDGTVCKLDFYVLNEVCKQIKKWNSEGKEVPVISVNFSRWHLQNLDFVDDIMKIISDNEVDTSYLEVELTETSSIDDLAELADIARKLKSKGLSVAMDDFGKGYSSLTMLRTVPVDVIKIDKSFLFENSNAPQVEVNKKLLKHIVAMAKDLSMDILVEGVENEDQKDYLHSIGCSVVQGFFYAKPVNAEEFEKKLASD